MKRLFIFTLLVTMFTACTEGVVVEIVSPSSDLEYIYASIEEDTRVELNEHKKSVWTKGDKIIRIGDKTLDGWKFTGQTGDRSGNFSKSTTFDGYFDYDFKGEYVALYPYNSNISYAQFTNGDLAISQNIKKEQSYHPNSYDPTSNTMFGSSSDGKNFKFKNLMGYLCISLTGDKSVKKIIVTGNNNETISGDLFINIFDTDVTAWNNQTSYNTITLNCGSGVQLTDEPTQFYFAIPPTTFTKGISVVVYFSDETQYPINTAKQLVLERNTIQPMANVNTGEEIEWQTITIQHSGELVYTPLILNMSGDLATAGYIYWGDNNQTSMKEIPESYVYVDAEDEHTITIKTQNATYLYLEKCTGISEIDLTNF